MAVETRHNTNIVPGKIANRGEFDSGIRFCVEPGQFEIGRHYTERTKLPVSERRLFDDDRSLPPNEKPFAEDKTIVVTGMESGKLLVADLFHENGELISGDSRQHTLSPEGWILPEKVPLEAMGNLSDQDIIKGYFLNFDGLQDDALAAAEAMAVVVARSRVVPKLVPGYLDTPPEYHV